MLTTVLFIDHRESFSKLASQGSVEPLVQSYGTMLGNSIQTTISALQQIPDATGMKYWILFYTILTAGAHVLWYVKSVTMLVRRIQPDISPIVVWSFTGAVYLSIVYAVTGWLPSAGSLEALMNVVELFDFGRANPLSSPGNVSNITNSSTVDPMNQTVRGN